VFGTRSERVEPTTLVTFELEDAEGGTRLRIVGSGFDALPLDWREDARESNDEGWTIQAERIAKHSRRRLEEGRAARWSALEPLSKLRRCPH
jgi:hypothetical protein